MSIEEGTLLRNNLGGLGPWRSGDAEIRVGRVGEVEGRAFDLRIRNTSAYRAPSAGLLNGLADDGTCDMSIPNPNPNPSPNPNPKPNPNPNSNPNPNPHPHPNPNPNPNPNQAASSRSRCLRAPASTSA